MKIKDVFLAGFKAGHPEPDYVAKERGVPWQEFLEAWEEFKPYHVEAINAEDSETAKVQEAYLNDNLTVEDFNTIIKTSVDKAYHELMYGPFPQVELPEEYRGFSIPEMLDKMHPGIQVTEPVPLVRRRQTEDEFKAALKAKGIEGPTAAFALEAFKELGRDADET